MCLQTSDRLDQYVDALVEARKKKGLPRPSAYDMVKVCVCVCVCVCVHVCVHCACVCGCPCVCLALAVFFPRNRTVYRSMHEVAAWDVRVCHIQNDINMFGVMMVACGDADGMVSGAMHTTAATIRPAMQVRYSKSCTSHTHTHTHTHTQRIHTRAREHTQRQHGCHESVCDADVCAMQSQVLKPPTKTIVSSVFFMCLPDEVSHVRTHTHTHTHTCQEHTRTRTGARARAHKQPNRRLRAHTRCSMVDAL